MNSAQRTPAVGDVWSPNDRPFVHWRIVSVDGPAVRYVPNTLNRTEESMTVDFLWKIATRVVAS